EDEKALGRARAALQRAREVASGLVGLATGRAQPPRPRPERLAEIIQEHAKLLGDELAGSGIAVELELDRTLKASVDRSALVRILDNLTRTAQRAMPEGGKLVLGCREMVSGEQRRAVAWVADTGPGIPADRLASLFQLTDDLASRGGLGLVLVRDLVESL